MLQSIHAILHNILQEYSTVLDSAYYSTIRITILILQCSCEQIYFQAFLFQKHIAEIHNQQEFYIQLASSFHMKCTVCRNNILLGELQFFNRLLLDYIQSTCTQTTCSLQPLESTTQPTRNFLLGESAHSTRRKQDKNSTSRSLNTTGI